jgi:2-polyprenyl-3-methyl-5-hydroxy-6-metoxy-1,4-benzoquinol methylase
MVKIGDRVTAKTACPNCSSWDSVVISTIDGKTGQALMSLECLGCGLGRIDPLPTSQELESWYSTAYRQDYKSMAQPSMRHVLRAGRNALERWRRIRDDADALDVWCRDRQQQPRTLDIGASSGEFVFLMRSLGFDAMGIEPHQGYATYARQCLGLTIHNGTLQRQLQELRDHKFDLISMFHVFEHLVDPLPTLQRLRAMLSPQGMICIEVPDATRFTSPRYMFFRAHTLYFTALTLQQMLETAGFEVVLAPKAQESNLIIVAKPAMAHEPMQLVANANMPLLKAQMKRRWLPYLWLQLRHGRLGQKLQRRKEEKQTAAGFSDAKSLLQTLYLDDAQNLASTLGSHSVVNTQAKLQQQNLQPIQAPRETIHCGSKGKLFNLAVALLFATEMTNA